MLATVSITRETSYERERIDAAVEAVLAPLGGMRAFVKAGQRVLVKPNLLGVAPPERCVTTHPEVVRAVVRRLKDLGAHPYVGDSPSMASGRWAAKKSGILDVCEELDVPFVEFKRPRKAPNPRGRVFQHLTVDAAALEADAIVSCPKVKAHRQCYFTCAVKNLFGCVSGKRKALWHFKAGNYGNYFAYMLVENWNLLRPVVSVVDGVMTMEGDGPGDGTPYPLGLLLAGEDAPALDRVLLEILGADPEQHGQTLAARELGHGETDLARITIHGPALETLKVTDFHMPPKMVPIGFSLPRVVKSTLKGAWIQSQEGSGHAA